MKWSKYNFECGTKNGKTIIYNSLINKFLVLDENEEYKNECKEIDDQLLGFYVDDATDEKKQMEMYLKRQVVESNVFSCWIFVTGGCNLSCSYCWENKEHFSKSNMTTDTCDKILVWIKKFCDKENIKKLVITLTGGEPLLNVPIIEKIVNEINDWEVEVKYQLITNGVLLNSNNIAVFNKLGIKTYQISIDGTKEIHDQRRYIHNGIGTFEKIIGNIFLLGKLSPCATIIVRINIDEENVDTVSKLIRFLKKMGLNKLVVITMTDTIIDCVKASTHLLNQILYLLEFAKQCGFYVSLPEMNRCWMTSKYWMMFDTDGKFYKCPDLVGNENLSVGSVDNGLKIDKNKRQTDLRTCQSCINCEIVGLCAGGCLYRNRVQNENKLYCRKEYIRELLLLKAQWRIEHENTVDKVCHENY